MEAAILSSILREYPHDGLRNQVWLGGKISQKLPKYSGKVLCPAASCGWVSEEDLMLLRVIL